MSMADDETEFARLVDAHRPELRVHCCRMLGSFVDAEDHVQETLLRAWRNRDSFEGRSTLRAWLYRIATNVCLDTLRRHPDRVLLVGGASNPPPSEIPWLQRYIDAHGRADTDAMVSMMRADVRFAMPPQPTFYEGRVALGEFFAGIFGADSPGTFRLVPTRANRQPAAANYLRVPGDSEFRALSLDVLRFADGKLAEITTFEPALFRYFGLPDVLPRIGPPATD